MEHPDELLTPTQAAEIKKVHVHSVYRAIHEGRLIAEQRGGIFLIRRGDLGKWRARRGRFKADDG